MGVLRLSSGRAVSLRPGEAWGFEILRLLRSVRRWRCWNWRCGKRICARRLPCVRLCELPRGLLGDTIRCRLRCLLRRHLSGQILCALGGLLFGCALGGFFCGLASGVQGVPLCFASRSFFRGLQCVLLSFASCCFFSGLLRRVLGCFFSGLLCCNLCGFFRGLLRCTLGLFGSQPGLLGGLRIFNCALRFRRLRRVCFRLSALLHVVTGLLRAHARNLPRLRPGSREISIFCSVQIRPGIQRRHVFRRLVLVAQRIEICHMAPSTFSPPKALPAFPSAPPHRYHGRTTVRLT